MKLEVLQRADFPRVRAAFPDVIENTPNMAKYARWDYGKHPTDEIVTGYIDRGAMYSWTDDGSIAGIAAVTMSQGADYHDIRWSLALEDDAVAAVHTPAVTPAHHTYERIGFRRVDSRILYAANAGDTEFVFFELNL